MAFLLWLRGLRRVRVRIPAAGRIHKLFPGDPFRQSSQDRFEDCEAVCRDSESCVAFSFIKAELACRMFDSAGEYSNDEEADSGAKRQSVN